MRVMRAEPTFMPARPPSEQWSSKAADHEKLPTPTKNSTFWLYHSPNGLLGMW